jgi:hypothetical protein
MGKTSKQSTSGGASILPHKTSRAKRTKAAGKLKAGPKAWETYEEVARSVLDQCAEQFGLERFDGKQDVVGKSGATWEIDARGWAVDGSTFVVECKQHARTGISQAITGSLAFTIADIGGAGGFLVSPQGLQAGGKRVAVSSNIKEIKLDSKSTSAAWFGEWLGSLRVGFVDKVNTKIGERLQIVVRDIAGTVIETYDSGEGGLNGFPLDRAGEDFGGSSR